MGEKDKKFSFKKIFFMKSFFGSLVGKVELTDKPLNWLSIVFLIAFDIFIFINLMDGLDSQRQNITDPYTKYDYNCQSYFSQEKDLAYTDIENIINNDYNNQTYKNMNAPFYNENFVNDESSIYCMDLSNKLLAVKNNDDLKKYYDQILIINREISDLEKSKTNYETNYDNYRRDVEVGLTDTNDTIVDIDTNNIRNNYENIVDAKSQKQAELDDLIFKVNNLGEVNALKNYIATNKEQFNKEYNSYEFWYPVYVTLQESILIFPILLTTIFLYNFALKRRLRVLSILSSNLALITGIFAFYIFIKIIYFIIPKKFFANVLLYLASIKALAIWNYILTLFGLLVFGLLMFISQKSIDKIKKIKEEQARERELFDKERIAKERFWNHLCIKCNTRLLNGATHCSNCGENQYKECTKCKNMLPKAYTYCEKCGEKN